eukprot:COSAG06_NODE_2005_length_7867_cov_6.370895_3_plen_34_part_00
MRSNHGGGVQYVNSTIDVPSGTTLLGAHVERHS